MDLNLQDPWTAGIVAVLALVVIGLLLRLLGMAVKAVILVVLIAAAAGLGVIASRQHPGWRGAG